MDAVFFTKERKNPGKDFFMILYAIALAMIIYEFFSDDHILAKLAFLGVFALAWFVPARFPSKSMNIIAIIVLVLLSITLFFKNGLYNKS